MCVLVCMLVLVCVLVCMCVHHQNQCAYIWKGGVNLLYICFSCPEVKEVSCVQMYACDKQHTHTYTHTLVNVHDDSAPYVFCGRAQMWF